MPYSGYALDRGEQTTMAQIEGKHELDKLARLGTKRPATPLDMEMNELCTELNELETVIFSLCSQLEATVLRPEVVHAMTAGSAATPNAVRAQMSPTGERVIAFREHVVRLREKLTSAQSRLDA